MVKWRGGPFFTLTGAKKHAKKKKARVQSRTIVIHGQAKKRGVPIKTKRKKAYYLIGPKSKNGRR